MAPAVEIGVRDLVFPAETFEAGLLIALGEAGYAGHPVLDRGRAR